MVKEMMTYTKERFPELENLFLDWHRIESVYKIPNIAEIYSGNSIWAETFYRTLANEFLHESGVYEEDIEELIYEFIEDAYSMVKETLQKKLKEYTLRHGIFIVDSDEDEGYTFYYNVPVVNVW